MPFSQDSEIQKSEIRFLSPKDTQFFCPSNDLTDTGLLDFTIFQLFLHESWCQPCSDLLRTLQMVGEFSARLSKAEDDTMKEKLEDDEIAEPSVGGISAQAKKNVYPEDLEI